MNLLLDTHTFIWLANEPDKLSSKAQSLITTSHNKLFLSIASIWEMAIKKQLGKLELKSSLSSLLAVQQQINKIDFLSISVAHVLLIESLPSHHKDPFDRLLIAQSTEEGLSILSVDTIFDCYDVRRIW